MKIFTYELGPVATNAYLLVEGSEAVLIDAPDGVSEAIQADLKASQAQLTTLLLTHGHWDHTAGFGEILSEKLEVVANDGDKALYENPEIMSAFMSSDLQLVPIQVDKWVEGGQVLEVLGKRCQILHVPGHSPGNIAFYFPEEGKVFVGDALFAGSIGRTDLPGGSFATLEQSIKQKLYTLPDQTVVYPGHGPTTTVKEEKETNPFVRG